MNRKGRNPTELSRLAAGLGPEDGLDPREFHGRAWNSQRQASRKGLQLCAQVKDALRSALAACADAVLQGIEVVGVLPSPHTGRLDVLVSAPSDLQGSSVREALARASGFLRSEVATAINRRKVPELVFEVFEM